MDGRCLFHHRVISASTVDHRLYLPFAHRRPLGSPVPSRCPTVAILGPDQFVRERLRSGTVPSDGACRPPIGQFPELLGTYPQPISPLPLPGAITTRTAISFQCRGHTRRANLPPTSRIRNRRRPIGPRAADGGESAPSSILEIGKGRGLHDWMFSVGWMYYSTIFILHIACCIRPG
jgi:hypothetical protein